MATDRFVRFSNALFSCPETAAMLAGVLEDYIRGLGSVSKDSSGRLYASLQGPSTSPLARTPSASPPSVLHEERWFEVIVEENSLDILTRAQDQVTCVIADGFADLCAQFWSGVREA